MNRSVKNTGIKAIAVLDWYGKVLVGNVLNGAWQGGEMPSNNSKYTQEIQLPSEFLSVRG